MREFQSICNEIIVKINPKMDRLGFFEVLRSFEGEEEAT